MRCKIWSKTTILVAVIVLFTCSMLCMQHRNLTNKPSSDTTINPPTKPFKIYVYPWPEDVTNRWPVAFQHHRLSIAAQFALHHGAGPLINEDEGFYHTHQYTLFSLFLYRLLQSKYLTKNPSEATVFFVPYDLGMDASTRQSDAALTATNCPKINNVMKLLQTSPYYQKSSGSDHVMVHSINHMMLHFVNKECRKLYAFCYNCTKLSIDVYSGDLYSFLDTAPYMTHRWYSIPFPSNFHTTSKTTKPPWKTFQSDDETFFAKQLQMFKTHSLGFVGGIDVTSKKNKAVRVQIVEYCLSAPQHCLLNSLASHSSNVEVQLNNSVANSVYGKSIFCFSPGGDFPTRKGFFDALLSGCIPVVFEEASAAQQWRHHWGSIATAQRCTHFISRESFLQTPHRYFDDLILLSRNTTYLKEKFACIRSVGSRLQYSLSNEDRLEMDAFDISVKMLMDNSIV